MKASVVIPTYNREQQLVDSIAYVLANTYPDFELIVVDQTEQHTPAVASALNEFQQDDRFRLVELPVANLPFARNVGLRAAEGEVVIYVDDDVELGPDFIAQHVKRYTDPTVGAVAGRIVTPGIDNGNGSSPKPKPGRLNWDGHNESHFNQSVYSGEVEWGQGCNMSFRRTALEHAGAFDERFTQNAIHEEVDAFTRVRATGHKAVFEPEALLVHLKEASGGCRSQQDELRYLCSLYRNKSLYFIKNTGWSGWMRYTLRVLSIIYSAARMKGLGVEGFFRLVGAHTAGVYAHYAEDQRELSSAKVISTAEVHRLAASVKWSSK